MSKVGLSACLDTSDKICFPLPLCEKIIGELHICLRLEYDVVRCHYSVTECHLPENVRETTKQMTAINDGN